jgi:hypothetical protein
MPYWVLIDWADVDTRGESAAYNAIFAAALEATERIAGVYGDRRMRMRARLLRTRIRESFVPRFFDERRGMFADANVDGVLSSKVSEHANLLAVGHGLCDPGRVASVLDSVYKDDALVSDVTRAEPFFTWQVLKALDTAGRFPTALAIVRRRWGWMLDRGQTSASEEWGRHGSWRRGDEYAPIMRTESHAWSAAPAEFLTRILAGIEILEPGCRKLKVSPKTNDPASYTVAFPTPLGTVKIENRQGDVRYTAPPGIEINLEQPGPESA